MRLRLAALLVLALPQSAWAAQVTLGPYVQDVREDGFVVAYETDVATDGMVVAGAERVVTHGTHHEARVGKQAPGSRVRYRVLVDGVERAAAEVGTAPSGDKPVTFVVYGDTRDGEETERKIARAILAETPDFAVHTGDLVRKGSAEDSWPLFFANEAPLLSTVPVLVVVGNHELYEDPAGEHVARYLPLPGDGRTRHYYTLRWGAVRLIVLDGNDHFAEQAAWLEETLTAAEREHARHVFVFMHQPPFSTGGHCGAAPLEKDWIPLFERHQVRAVFSGHDHCYERLERSGVRYFVSGGGGAGVYAERESCAAYDLDARRTYAAEYHYLRVRVVGDEVEVTAVRLDAGRPPIEVVSFHDPAPSTGTPPPIVPELVASSPWAGHVLHVFGGRWPLAAGGLVLLLVARGLLRRRRS
jgi:predicted phosphodiesterase